MDLERSYTIRRFRRLPRDKKIDSKNIDVLLPENVKGQKKNNEMPKGTRLSR